MQKQQLVRLVGAGAAFAFAVEWVAQGFEAAVFCALAAALGFLAVVGVQRSSFALPTLDVAALKGRVRSLLGPRPAPSRPRRRPSRAGVDVASAEHSGYGW